MTTLSPDISCAQTLPQLFSNRVALTPDAPAYRLYDLSLIHISEPTRPY